MFQLLYPFKDGQYAITQSFAEHVERAKRNGWCYEPGMTDCSSYYYGGIDFGCPQGTYLVASMDMTCTIKHQETGYGRHIIGTDATGKHKLIYAHLSTALVKDGARVKAGDVIAKSGGVPGSYGAGYSTGAHLHYEFRINNIPTDPYPYLVYSIGTTPPATPGEGEISIGDSIQLKPEYSYVNIRTSPSLAGIDVGDFLPGASANVLGFDPTGQWIKIFDNWGIQLWVHASYVCKR
jgi:hypothetical protein